MPGLMIATERQVFDELEAAIQADFMRGNHADLAANYAKGAALYERQGEIDAACFFWTQAYVLALDGGADKLAMAVFRKLNDHGRMG